VTVAIRPEALGDEDSIRSLTRCAFAEAPRSDGSEAAIIDRLRAEGDLALSLVAEADGTIVGHIAFSPVSIADGTSRWFGLGPVSVSPERQGGGIGSRLVRRGLDRMTALGAHGIVLLGNPDFYRRFGFAHDPELKYPGPPQAYFQRMVIGGPAPSGVVSYAPAFR
jgi:putative acetyltransferase